ncbi:phosphoribosylformylglycinamidine synthase I [Halobaculum sp. MBLA0143]|uniref:phosphoribosylformylglycinamidine synthase I n=1 Tax=Halobaculum sp. MBLA0143 TaxID=3079933 RepID=UPI0035259CB7
MTVAVVQFGGSNCDRDAVRALSHLGVDARLVWHDDGLAAGAGVDEPTDLDGVVLPGGFSYGDYLRAGAIAARTPILAEVQEAATAGVPVLGVCNGAQVGAESGLVAGAFTTNASARFQCEHVHLRVERADTPWTAAYDAGEVIEVPIAHAEGRFVADDETAARLAEENRVLFRYCEPDGSVTDAANPNGSRDNVAGVLGERDTVAVTMPHPERATLPDIGGTDGQGVLRAFA